MFDSLWSMSRPWGRGITWPGSTARSPNR